MDHPYDLSSPGALAEAISLLHTARRDAMSMKYTTVASVALLAYDIVLTFPDEYEFIWCSKVSGYSLMYAVMRYGNLLHMLTIQMLFYNWDDAPLSMCKPLLLVNAWTLLPLIIPLFVTLTLRAYATCGRSQMSKWFLGAFCLLVILAELAGNILWTMQAKVTGVPMPGFPCIYKVTTASPVIGAVLQTGPTALLDSVMFAVIAWKTYQSYRTGKTYLVKVIFRDSLWYLALSIETVACMLLFICLRGVHAALQPTLSSEARTMAVIVASRVILNVRHAAGNSGVKMSLESLTVLPRRSGHSSGYSYSTESESGAYCMTDLQFSRSMVADTTADGHDQV